MVDPQHPLVDLLRRDSRYHFDAYIFVFDALQYAQEHLGLGSPLPEPKVSLDDLLGDSDEDTDEEFDEDFGEPDTDGLDDTDDLDADDLDEEERHITGQQLCEAIRLYALDQYGLMAKGVLNHWGVKSTGDFGEIVFSLIEIGQMRKTPHDRREDFEDVYSFEEALRDGFEICHSDSTEGRSS